MSRQQVAARCHRIAQETSFAATPVFPVALATTTVDIAKQNVLRPGA
jgi:hypothetical protein